MCKYWRYSNKSAIYAKAYESLDSFHSGNGGWVLVSSKIRSSNTGRIHEFSWEGVHH